MTFTSAILNKGTLGSVKVSFGTFTNSAGGTGGDIDTGIPTCAYLDLQHTGAAVVAKDPVVNETLPVAGNAVTMVSEADKSGIWMAFGW